MNFLLETLRLGLANLMLHKLRSLLTALGIIIGVAAVVAIAAYGEGSKQKALADIRQLGADNIIVRSVKPPEPANAGQTTQRMLVYGIKEIDLRRIQSTVQPITQIVPLKQVGSRVTNRNIRVQAAVFGSHPNLLQVTSLNVEVGRYLSDMDEANVENSAVIGAEVASRLFPLTDPLDAEFRIDNQVFKVVGVLRKVGLAGGAGSALVGRDLNFDIHIPMSTAKSRFGDVIVKRSAGSTEATRMELSEIYIQVQNQEHVKSVAEQINQIMDATHNAAGDVQVIVPLELLEQAERTQLMFNVLMIIIAGLSLLVGGIGIMNIMLASVTERTREIGIRRALGATRRHVIAQFLVETTVLSCIGGFIGVALGVGGALTLTYLHTIWPAIEKPQITIWSIVVSFVVAVGVGIIFGLYPAIQAARQDPIVALRHD